MSRAGLCTAPRPRTHSSAHGQRADGGVSAEAPCAEFHKPSSRKRPVMPLTEGMTLGVLGGCGKLINGGTG
jgi:hypothetical protein